MSKFDLALPDVFGSWFRQLWLWHRFKFVLPKIETTTIDGVRLDLRSFTPKVRNRILMGYEEAERTMCREILASDDSVLEIGGGIGFIGLFCQIKIGVRRYITIEANPATIHALRKNYEMNGITPNVLHFALGKADEMIDLNIGGDFWEHFTAIPCRRNLPNRLRVPAKTLGSLLNEAENLPAPSKPGKINALIIDVEGAERFIDFSELPDRINKIVIELHPSLIGQRAATNVLAKLTERGFRIAREMEETFALTRN